MADVLPVQSGQVVVRHFTFLHDFLVNGFISFDGGWVNEDAVTCVGSEEQHDDDALAVPHDFLEEEPGCRAHLVGVVNDKDGRHFV